MAALTQTSKSGPNSRVANVNTLTASDTITYAQGQGQEIFFHNPTGGSITAVITGSAAVTGYPPGGGQLNYATGLNVIVPAGASRIVVCDNVQGFLQGNITITGGTGLMCWVWTAV